MRRAAKGTPGRAVGSAPKGREAARLDHFREKEPDERSRRFTRVSHFVTAATLIVCAGLVIAGIFAGIFESVATLRGFLAGLGLWAPLAFIALSAAQSVFPVLPGGITVIAAPVLFGVVGGTLYSYIGAIIGSVAAFLIARRLGMSVLRARFKPTTLTKYLGWLTHPHFPRYFALAIALPVAPDDFLCYLAGMTTMRLRTFMVIIVLLKPWAILAYSFGILTLLSMVFPRLGL